MTSASPVGAAHQGDTLVIEPDEAADYLTRLEIKASDLRDAVLEGHHEAANHSGDFYPVNAAGLSRWMETVRVLRERLNANSEAWNVANPHNRPVMHRADREYEVAAHRGSTATGVTGGSPMLARPAGKKTVESVNRLRSDAFALISVAELLPTTDTAGDDDPSAPPSGTWILLYHPGDEGIQCEFSLPTGMTPDGTIEGWQVRVLLNTVAQEQDGVTLPPADDRGGDDVLFNIE
jgi:hypothetical protein